jgi:hypothetical protein
MIEGQIKSGRNDCDFFESVGLLPFWAITVSNLMDFGGTPPFKGVLRWPDNNSMFRRLSCNMATSKE